MIFAKSFVRGERQVVVMRDTNDDGDPCISFHYQPEFDGFGICIGRTSYDTVEEADKWFEWADEESAWARADAMESAIKEAVELGIEQEGK